MEHINRKYWFTPRSGSWLIAIALTVNSIALPASADTIPPRDIGEPPESSSCPVDESSGSLNTVVPEDGFRDVPTTSTHEFAIDCIAWYGVTAGTSANTYDPGGPVRREQLASFIVRLIDYAADEDNAGSIGPGEVLPTAPTDNQFPCDVSRTNVHYVSIQRLAAAGITDGTHVNGEGQFCFSPGANVTRAQMAAFLASARQYVTRVAIDLTGEADYFVDDDGNYHENDINVLAALGITQGSGIDEGGGKLYSPASDIRRDQMGALLARTLDHLVQEEEIRPPLGS